MGNPQLPPNLNIALPPSIRVHPDVVVTWPIDNSSTYQITMDVNDPQDQEGNQRNLTKDIGLFYCTDTPYTLDSPNKWQNYSDYYNNQGPPETIQSYQMYGSKLYGFALLPLVEGSEPDQFIIGSDFGVKNDDGTFQKAGSGSYWSGPERKGEWPVDGSNILSGGITIYTKCIDEHQKPPSKIKYIGKLPGPTTLIFDLRSDVYLHVLAGNQMYVFTQKDSNMYNFFNIKPNENIVLFAALAATPDGKFEIGDPRVDAAMTCTRVTR